MFFDFSVREVVCLILPLFLGAGAVCASLALWSKMRTPSRAFLCAGVASGYGAMLFPLLQKIGVFGLSTGLPFMFSREDPVSFLSVCFFALSVASPLCMICACVFFLAEDSH